MNIIDTSSNSKILYSSNLIKNVPLFKIKLLTMEPTSQFKLIEASKAVLAESSKIEILIDLS